MVEVLKLCKWLAAEEEFEVVEAALEGADRYYCVLSLEPSRGQGSAEQMAAAFKSVAGTWLQQHKVCGLCCPARL